jgi:hypothetical protein
VIDWTDLGKILLLLGGLIVLAGLGLMLLGRVPFFGRLPGDLTVSRGNWSCYVPIISSILLSLLLTLVLNMIMHLFRR